MVTARPQVAHEISRETATGYAEEPEPRLGLTVRMCAMRRGSSGVSMGGEVVNTRKRKRKPPVVSEAAMKHDERSNADQLRRKFGSRPMPEK